MAYGYGGWAPYVPVSERRKNAAREVEKLRKAGRSVSPVIIEGRVIASTFWGRSWCDNMESYRDFENRLPRGRTYVRNGSVVDLQITPLEIKALVSGSSIYKVTVAIKALAPDRWRSIRADCAGGIDSLVDLLQGRFSKSVMERLCRQDGGLFPKPSEIRFSCSCPDGALMCKHVAAVLYGIGARLDREPELLFRLRAVDENELVANLGRDLPFSACPPAGAKVLDTDDLAALFGLDMESAAGPSVEGADTGTVDPETRFDGTTSVRKAMKRKAKAASPAPPSVTPNAPTTKSHPAGRRLETINAEKAASATARERNKIKDDMVITEDGFVKWWK